MQALTHIVMVRVNGCTDGYGGNTCSWHCAIARPGNGTMVSYVPDQAGECGFGGGTDLCTTMNAPT